MPDVPSGPSPAVPDPDASRPVSRFDVPVKNQVDAARTVLEKLLKLYPGAPVSKPAAEILKTLPAPEAR